MNWSTEADVRQQIERRWQRGDLLRSLVTGEPAFPIRLRLRAPASRDLRSSFGDAQEWLSTLLRIPRIRVEWKASWTVHAGSQRLPESVWVDSVEDALALLGREAEAAIFHSLHECTSDHIPSLIPWLLQHPLRSLQFHASWDRLLRVVAWIREHPMPGVFLRQVDVPDVDSKFLEDHAGILTNLLDGSLNPAHIDEDYRGTGVFAQRYGFLAKPTRVRFRILDASIQFAGTKGIQDVELDAGSFAELKLPLSRLRDGERNQYAGLSARRSIHRRLWRWLQNQVSAVRLVARSSPALLLGRH